MNSLSPLWTWRIWAPICLAVALAPTVHATEVINEVSQLYPIVVEGVVAPTTLEQLVAVVKQRNGPLSIGGGRYSMGGQTATEQAVQIDMRRFNRVLSFSAEKKEITVQAGITWREIQEHIDPYDLSLQVMQTYANFTVGGALSVNAHGRYIGLGPLVLSVKSIRLVLANGDVTTASPKENSELFYGAIGGYGALGVIAEATLSLTDNVHVDRRSIVMPLSSYGRYFATNIRNNPAVIFHNADIYPNSFDTVRATSYVSTDKPLTVTARLVPADKEYRTNRAVFQIISEWPAGKWIRQHAVDPVVFYGHSIESRNFEASYDVRDLEPNSRKTSTYVLQEYFVPIEKLEAFVPAMGDILNRHRVNVINISIRHAKPDPGTLMAWARTEVFAFVLYYKQGTSDLERKAVADWTRELIDAAVSYGGAYYLPYQIWASREQFYAAYPNAGRLFELKRRVDPTYKFRNKLWDAYYEPAPSVPSAMNSIQMIQSDKLQSIDGYRRDEAQTFLTLPEWSLVYLPADYAQSLRRTPPSAFRYFSAISQFWSYYRQAWRLTKDKYAFNFGYHAMVFVIGASHSVEYAIKGVYENTLGRMTEWTTSKETTAEDKFAADYAQHYVDFIRVRPWYEFSFIAELKRLWRETPVFGGTMIRKWERRLVLSGELLVKAEYATLIAAGTRLAYGIADREVLAVTSAADREVLAHAIGVGIAARLDNGDLLLKMPRYEAFRDAVQNLSAGGVEFRQIAGNGSILMTCIVPTDWRYDLSVGSEVFTMPTLGDPTTRRIGVTVPVPSLHLVVNGFRERKLSVEHIYDY